MGTPKVLQVMEEQLKHEMESSTTDLHDPELMEKFHVTGATQEFSKWGGTWVAVTCMSCPSKWAMHLGEHGELDKGERNVILAHAKEHERKGFRMRRLVR